MTDTIVDLNEIDKAFYIHYGRALANWAQLENSLGSVFARLTGLKGRLATDVFYSARSFLGRADMVLACIPSAPTVPAGKEFLTRSVGRAMAYSSFRNKLAHNLHTLEWGDFDEDGKPNINRQITSGVAGPDYGAEVIETAAQNFGIMAALLVVSLGSPKLLREPELSLALLDLLPTEAAVAQRDPAAVAKQISELASHPD